MNNNVTQLQASSSYPSSLLHVIVTYAFGNSIDEIYDWSPSREILESRIRAFLQQIMLRLGNRETLLHSSMTDTDRRDHRRAAERELNSMISQVPREREKVVTLVTNLLKSYPKRNRRQVDLYRGDNILAGLRIVETLSSCPLTTIIATFSLSSTTHLPEFVQTTIEEYQFRPNCQMLSHITFSELYGKLEEGDHYTQLKHAPTNLPSPLLSLIAAYAAAADSLAGIYNWAPFSPQLNAKITEFLTALRNSIVSNPALLTKVSANHVKKLEFLITNPPKDQNEIPSLVFKLLYQSTKPPEFIHASEAFSHCIRKMLPDCSLTSIIATFDVAKQVTFHGGGGIRSKIPYRASYRYGTVFIGELFHFMFPSRRSHRYGDTEAPPELLHFMQLFLCYDAESELFQSCEPEAIQIAIKEQETLERREKKTKRRESYPCCIS